jgi:hypothetical protein
MVRNNSRGPATSTIWKTICREWRTTFAPVLISFSRNVVNVQGRAEKTCSNAAGSQNPEKQPVLAVSQQSNGKSRSTTASVQPANGGIWA